MEAPHQKLQQQPERIAIGVDGSPAQIALADQMCTEVFLQHGGQ
jgi:hypothetical protein